MTTLSKPLKNVLKSLVGLWPLDVGSLNTYQSVSLAANSIEFIRNDILGVIFSTLYPLVGSWRFVQTASRAMGGTP